MSCDRSRRLRAAPKTQSNLDLEYGNVQHSENEEEIKFQAQNSNNNDPNVRWSLQSEDSMNDHVKHLSNDVKQLHEDDSDSMQGKEEDYQYDGAFLVHPKEFYDINPDPRSSPTHKYKSRSNCLWMNRCMTSIAVLATFCGVALGGFIFGRYVTQNELLHEGTGGANAPASTNSSDTSTLNLDAGPKAPMDIDTTGMTRVEKIYFAVAHFSDAQFLSHNFTVAQTPQERALEWIAILDPNVVPEDDPQLAERYGLLVLYYALGGDSWSDATNWLIHRDICDWSGVSCDSRSLVPNETPKRVLTNIDLSSRKLVGFVPKEIAALSHLEYLALHSNPGLEQELPASIGFLTNLKSLQIYDTGLSGTIPGNIGMLQNLNELYLHRNALQGEIPAQVTSLTNLQELLLYKNRLTGPIPASMGGLKNLQRAWLSDNMLTGVLPPTLGDISNLRALYVDHNRLEGPLPGALASANQLSDIRLNNNTFTGEIPEEWIALRSLQILYLDHNEMSGSIPIWMGRFPDLQFLQLDRNGFTGPIPEELARATSLRVINLASNGLTGKIPPSLGNLPLLEGLLLHDNDLEGTIPESFATLRHLRKLNLSQNSKLQGTLPTAICGLGLKELRMDCSVACPCCTSQCGASQNGQVNQQPHEEEGKNVLKVSMGRSNGK